MPTLEGDSRLYGVAVKRVEYPAGVGGVRLSLSEIARRIYEGSRAPSMRAFAEGIVRNWARVPANVQITNRQAAQTFLDYVRAAVRYRPDPPLTEYTQSAPISLCVPGAPMCVPVGDCFPEGTLLLRDDFAFVPVEEIKPGERIWGKDKWTTVEARNFKGLLKVDAVEMNNGSTMYLTPDHKVYVGRCKHSKGVECPTCNPAKRKEFFVRVPVGDLQNDDVLLQPEKIDFGELSPDPDRTYVEGLCLADGWVRDNCKCFYVSGRDGMRKEKQKHEVKAICEKLGIQTRWHRRYIVVYDREWSMRLMQLGKRARFKHLETINLTRESAEAALRGVMADSTPSNSRTKEDGARTYSTTSPTMMLQVRVLHRMFGTSTSLKMLTPEQHGGAGKHPLWRVATRHTNDGRQEKTLTVRSIERAVKKVACWDIQTEDHYVYLPEHDVTVSNCDDLVTALATLAAAYGIPVHVVKQAFGGDQQEHVLVEMQDDAGQWLAADPSVPDKPLGWKAPAAHEDVIDPSDPSSIGLVGAPEAEFIGVGRIGAWHGRLRQPRSVVQLVGHGLGSVGVAQAPAAPSYQLVTDRKIYSSNRYRVGMLVNFLGSGYSGLSTENQRGVLVDNLPDWNIEQLGPTGDVTGGIQSWILQGVARTDMTLTDTPLITYSVIAGQVTAPGTTPAPPPLVGSGNIGVAKAAFVALAVGAAATVGSRMLRRRRR